MPAHGETEPSRAFRLVVGLGNPGRKYRGTRHNVGFLVLDELARVCGTSFSKEKKWGAEVAKLPDGTVLVKPQTFMNLSGEAVSRLAQFFKIEPPEVLVVFDDLDLPLGKLRFRLRGSAGGHNGVKSIIQHLGTNAFPRLKIGIGKSEITGGPAEAVGHVLGKFSKNEQSTLENAVETAIEALLYARTDGLEAAMTEYNRRDRPEGKAEDPPNASDS